MTIGEISQEIGLSADTLRYYEKIGLLPNVPRDNSGKRNYDENFINWIKFIQTMNCQSKCDTSFKNKLNGLSQFKHFLGLLFNNINFFIKSSLDIFPKSVFFG